MYTVTYLKELRDLAERVLAEAATEMTAEDVAGELGLTMKDEVGDVRAALEGLVNLGRVERTADFDSRVLRYRTADTKGFDL